MKRLDLDYYVGLLSAALYHGAAHQQPQVFQVMIATKRKNIQCGQISIQFITNQQLSKASTSLLNTRSGTLKVSTLETTARDLLLFIRQSGGIGQIATVVDELADKLDKETLQALVLQSEQWQWVQRLGYLLEVLGHSDLADSLFETIQGFTHYSSHIGFVPLLCSSVLSLRWFWVGVSSADELYT